jgi:hypothetical protein
VSLTAAWIAFRTVAFAEWRLIEFPDSRSYLAKAGLPLWDRSYFIGTGRFFVVPAFYKLLFSAVGPAKESIALGQFMLSLVSWCALAWCVAARSGRGWFSVLSLGAVLGLGASTEVIQWDAMVLSESVSTSLFAGLVAVWIRLADGVTNRRVAAVIAVAALWSMSREANSLLILPFAVASAVWAWRAHAGARATQLRCALLAAALFAIFLGTTAISANGYRWVFPLLNVIGTRVLPSPERTAFYRDRGMPLTPRLSAMAGEFASGQRWAFYRARELGGFRAWLLADGKRTFAADLAVHPLRTLAEPLADVGEFVCPSLSPYRYDPFPVLYRNLDGAWFCRPRAATGVVMLGAAVAVALWLVVVVRGRHLRPEVSFDAVTVAAMLLGSLPFTWFTWHVIGGMEIGRHVWSGVLMSRVGALLLLLFLIRGLCRVRARPLLA